MRLILLALFAAACTGASSDTADSAAVVTCVDDAGVVRAVGETWDAGDCANTCSCTEDGHADCTDLGCP
ncbi:MAG: hypothetical protein V4850_04495 [Myxococcota bacterium]